MPIDSKSWKILNNMSKNLIIKKSMPLKKKKITKVKKKVTKKVTKKTKVKKKLLVKLLKKIQKNLL